MTRTPILSLAAIAALSCAQPRTPAADSSATTATPAAATFTTVSMDRGPCFGTCPVYKVTVTGEGLVTWEGRRFVDTIKVATARLDAAGVAQLGRLFDEAYFAMDTAYIHGNANCPRAVTDLPMMETMIRTPAREKRIRHDLGCVDSAPRLRELYRQFDEITGTSRWIGKR